MNPRRILCVAGSTLSAIGLLVIMFSTLASTASAQEAPKTIAPKTEATTTDLWRVLADLQSGRGDAGVVALNNKIYVVSGYFSPGFGYSSSQEVYDPMTNTWEYLWGVPNPRSDMVVLAAGGKIYAIGGWNVDQGGVQDFNNMYDPTLDTWITKTSMITPVSGAGGVVISDTIYVIGGFDGISDTKSVQVYNTISDTWSTGTPMSITRSALGAVLLNGSIYAVGGTTNTNDVEIYNPISDTWDFGPALPASRFSIATAVRNGLIYVFGGTTSISSTVPTDTSFIFDPNSGMWSSGTSMPTARFDSQAALLGDAIYVIGGTGASGAGTANEAFGTFEILTSTTSIVSINPEPSQALQVVTVSFAVTSSIDVPTGVVTITSGMGSPQCSQALLDGAGSCEIAFDTPGTYPITATYSGDDFHSASSDTGSHTVVKADTTTRLTGVDSEPSQALQGVTVSFAVSSSLDTPTGVVTITSGLGSPQCSQALVNGMGSCEVAFTTPGIYTLTATYGGDAIHSASSDTGSHTVVKADTTTQLASVAPEQSLVLQPVTVSFTVTSALDLPTGMVTITSGLGSPQCSQALVNGMGSCEITFDTAGTYTLTGTYGGDDLHSASSDVGSHTVVKADTTTLLLGTAPEPSQAYQPVTVSFAVTSSLGVPTGVVTITSGSGSPQCSQALVNGMGSCEITFDTAGTYTLTGTYGGDDLHSASSDMGSHTVVKADTATLLLGVAPEPSLAGQAFTVTFEVTSTYGLPSGMVTVTANEGQQSCSDELVARMGSCAITLDAGGTYTITATYAGEPAFASSSDSATHQVLDSSRIFLPIIYQGVISAPARKR